MKTKNTNQLIVIEGISGSGKTEISKLLAQELQARYYTTPSALFKKNRKDADRTLSLESRFFFYVSSVVQASWEISKILETQSVVCDKYIWSTICYHRVYGMNVDLPVVAQYLQPDYVFLLFCDEGTRLQRLRKRGPIKDIEKYNLRQETERRCLVEFRQRLKMEIDNSFNGPQKTVTKILEIIMTSSPPSALLRAGFPLTA